MNTIIIPDNISEIAKIVKSDWENVNFAAVPYLNAMQSLNSINDTFISDSGRSIVIYFLANASAWRGEMAREVKAKLNQLLKKCYK